MSRRAWILGFALIGFLACGKTGKEPGSGTLFIIGGGERTPELIQSMLETADLKPGESILILPMASAEPEESAAYIREQIKTSDGAAHPIHVMDFRALPTGDPARIDSVRKAGLIYIPGGDQSR